MAMTAGIFVVRIVPVYAFCQSIQQRFAAEDNSFAADKIDVAAYDATQIVDQRVMRGKVDHIVMLTLSEAG